MQSDTPSRFFDDIHACWRPVADGRKVIPFCTPVNRQPEALVIGKNHSWFDPSPEREHQIAEAYANALPQVNTFLQHDHTFAIRLRKYTQAAGIEVTENWVGTNRCAVQTGPDGIGELQRAPGFLACQLAMDRILLEFIHWLEPKNILLFGTYAHLLLYPKAKRLADATPKRLDLRSGASCKLLPLPHLSFRGSPAAIVDVLRVEYEKGTSD